MKQGCVVPLRMPFARGVLQLLDQYGEEVQWQTETRHESIRFPPMDQMIVDYQVRPEPLHGATLTLRAKGIVLRFPFLGVPEEYPVLYRRTEPRVEADGKGYMFGLSWRCIVVSEEYSPLQSCHAVIWDC